MFIVLLGAAAAAVAVLLAVVLTAPPPAHNATFETADTSPPENIARPIVRPSLPPRRSSRLEERRLNNMAANNMAMNNMAVRRSDRLAGRPYFS
jgi:hypothetical protein